MKPVILFRKDFRTEEEYQIAQQYLYCVELRTQVPKNSLIIGRYSCLPYYRELEKDLASRNCQLINNYSQHAWIADFQYYEELKHLTPRTWFDRNFYTCDYSGPFIIKGATNSRKHQFKTLMYAETRKDAQRIASELANDPLIGPQGIIYREYVPLKTFEVDINGLPYANEFRFFYYKKTLLSYGYYWSCAERPELGKIDDKGLALAQQVADIAANFVNFMVIDIAETVKGDWILIELNDGQMSGLSMNDAHILYKNLANILVMEKNHE